MSENKEAQNWNSKISEYLGQKLVLEFFAWKNTQFESIVLD